MSTSNKKTAIHAPGDPIERLIFEKGLRIKTVFIENDLDILILVLNDGTVLKFKVSGFPGLSSARSEQLQKWELRNGGIGLHWPELDEDLSLYGFLKGLGKAAKIKRILTEGFIASLL
jgi:hypothetical protein